MGTAFDFFIFYTQLTHKLFNIRIIHVHANTSCQGSRIGKNIIAFAGEPVSCRGTHIPHGNDDRLSRILNLVHFFRNFLRCSRRTAGTVNAEKDALYPIILPRLFHFIHHLLAGNAF